jgi:hypothetical protein
MSAPNRLLTALRPALPRALDNRFHTRCKVIASYRSSGFTTV